MSAKYPSNLANLRDGLKASIETARDHGRLSFDKITIETGLRAQVPLEKLTAIPRITLVGLAFNQTRKLREQTRTAEFFVQFGIQAKVNPEKTDDCDRLLRLLEEVYDLAADDELVNNETFSFMRTDALRDENNLPYNLHLLRESATFEAVATPIYQKIITP